MDMPGSSSQQIADVVSSNNTLADFTGLTETSWQSIEAAFPSFASLASLDDACALPAEEEASSDIEYALSSLMDEDGESLVGSHGLVPSDCIPSDPASLVSSEHFTNFASMHTDTLPNLTDSRPSDLARIISAQTDFGFNSGSTTDQLDSSFDLSILAPSCQPMSKLSRLARRKEQRSETRARRVRRQTLVESLRQENERLRRKEKELRVEISRVKRLLVERMSKAK